ncbi:hypothetical protein ACFWA5_23580 [Streptomyces mirabilis]|uniref:hypothetical protein n=1 Tax=Streptomyces mirabilis TaxID=68239 RepID=UPI003667FE7B
MRIRMGASDAGLGLRAGALSVAVTWGVPGSDPVLPPDVAPPVCIARREGTRHG